MWFLTCDGDLFGGKRLWLRPGSTHLLGRTSGRSDGGERIQYINAKSVSRKHLIIRVGEVSTDDSARVHQRSEISFTDGSKMGSIINGDKILQETRILDAKEFVISLGNYQHELQLRWQPTILSFTGLSKKAMKADGGALKSQRENLAPADVKLVTDYVTNETTHVISKKRNTPTALQALAQGHWVVTEDFVDALGRAVHKDVEGISSLEQDFDINWPHEEDYLVPPAGEPHPRPSELLKPDSRRAAVFQNLTFVFLSQPQYELLSPVITAAGGKALVWEVEIGRSEPRDLVDWIKGVTGRSSTGSRQRPRTGGPVIVRLNTNDEKWIEFIQNVDAEVGRRSIEQNGFLDAILTLDTSGLSEELQDASNKPDQMSYTQSSNLLPVRDLLEDRRQQRFASMPSSPPPSADFPISTMPAQPDDDDHPQAESVQEVQDSVPQRYSMMKKRVPRVVTKSRFQGFDDFDPTQSRPAAASSPEPSDDEEGPSHSVSGHDVDVDDSAESSRREVGSLKRTHPETEAEMLDEMLTGVAAMKRRKLEAARNRSSASADDGAPAVSDEQLSATKPKKKERQIDVLAEVQKRREAEEEQRRKDEEALREGLDGIDISELRDLAKIKEMIVPPRRSDARTTGEHSERWNPAWNGRRNFKKFRPQGQRQDGPRLRPVLVTLEEVPKEGHGIGDEHWLTTSSHRSKSKSQSQSQATRNSSLRSQPREENGANVERFRRRLQHSREEDADQAVAEEALPEAIAGQPRDDRLAQTESAESQRRLANKRPATQQSTGPAPKKAKLTRAAAINRDSFALDDDDDGDELRFRRRRR